MSIYLHVYIIIMKAILLKCCFFSVLFVAFFSFSIYAKEAPAKQQSLSLIDSTHKAKSISTNDPFIWQAATWVQQFPQTKDLTIVTWTMSILQKTCITQWIYSGMRWVAVRYFIKNIGNSYSSNFIWLDKTSDGGTLYSFNAGIHSNDTLLVNHLWALAWWTVTLSLHVLPTSRAGWIFTYNQINTLTDWSLDNDPSNNKVKRDIVVDPCI